MDSSRVADGSPRVNERRRDFATTRVYCEALIALLERSRTEMSIPAYLTTWKPRSARPSYITSRCVGVAHFIVRLIVSPDCGEASEGSCQNDKIGCVGFKTLVRFRHTSVINAPVPNPLFSSVWALASHNPSGDRASADQIVAGPQPDPKARSATITSKIALRTAERLDSWCTKEPFDHASRVSRGSLAKTGVCTQNPDRLPFTSQKSA